MVCPPDGVLTVIGPAPSPRRLFTVMVESPLNVAS